MVQTLEMTTEDLKTPVKELIILGKGPSRKDCTYDKETWVILEAVQYAQKVDKVFYFGDWVGINTRELKEFQKKFGFEIISSVPHPNPNVQCTLYPIIEILEHFQTKFHANAITYMTALALYQGYQDIYWFGVDMLNQQSFITEKGCCEFWMGYALGSGRRVINTKSSGTGKTHNGKMYGDWSAKADIIKEITKDFVM